MMKVKIKISGGLPEPCKAPKTSHACAPSSRFSGRKQGRHILTALTLTPGQLAVELKL